MSNSPEKWFTVSKQIDQHQEEFGNMGRKGVDRAFFLFSGLVIISLTLFIFFANTFLLRGFVFAAAAGGCSWCWVLGAPGCE